MPNNQTNQLCENCNSHISAHRNGNGHIVTECQYCGTQSEDVNPLDLDVFDYEY